MHIFSVVVWLGALLYNVVVIFPAWRTDGILASEGLRAMIPFLWTGIVTVGVTGVLLMLFSTRFVFLSFPDWWSVALGLTQISYVIMAISSFGLVRVATMLGNRRGSSEADDTRALRARAVQLNASAVFFGVISLMLATSMHY